MKKPKMILFDYGHTLMYEPGADTTRGNLELLKHAVKNPNHCTIEDVHRAVNIIFGQHIETIRKLGYDVYGHVGSKAVYEYLGIELSLSPLEMETVFWDGCSRGAIMPDADHFLDYINSKHIRSAVISNLMWSGTALTNRLNRLLPNNQFEFVMTSSDYLFRKPNRILFDIALQKTGLAAEEVWYCGDNPQADVEGAAQSGIFPIWYDNPTDKYYKDRSTEKAPLCQHLHIHEWDELIEILDTLE